MTPESFGAHPFGGREAHTQRRRAAPGGDPHPGGDHGRLASAGGSSHLASAAPGDDRAGADARRPGGRRPPAGARPGELLDLTEWQERHDLAGLPEDLLSEALHGWAARSTTGAGTALRQVVLRGHQPAGRPRQRVPPAGRRSRRAAALIDGAGFAGGARVSLGDLLGGVEASLATIPGPLGRFARDPDSDTRAVDALMWPADAARTALVALWAGERQQ